jgi:hypothetical protein
MKKTQIKVTVSTQMKQDLQNVAALSGGSVPEVIRGYLRDSLYSPPRATQVPPPRAHEKKGSLKKKKKIGETTFKKESVSEHPAKATTLPPDFDPPEEHATRNQLDYEKAVAVFVNWAVKNEHKAVDWDIEFHGWCRLPSTQSDPSLRKPPTMNRRENRGPLFPLHEEESTEGP